MNFLAAAFGILLLVALVTGKAYFRGTYTRDDEPRKYWIIIGCYAVLTIAGLLMPLLHNNAARPRETDRPHQAEGAPRHGDGTSTWPRFELPFGLLTDAATRLAGELDDGAARARKATDGRTVVVHRPKPSPEGCADDYRVQFTQASALVIWCSKDGKVTSSHTTTSHLPAVAVPQTWIIDKRAGESLLVRLEKNGQQVTVTGVE